MIKPCHLTLIIPIPSPMSANVLIIWFVFRNWQVASHNQIHDGLHTNQFTQSTPSMISTELRPSIIPNYLSLIHMNTQALYTHTHTSTLTHWHTARHLAPPERIILSSPPPPNHPRTKHNYPCKQSFNRTILYYLVNGMTDFWHLLRNKWFLACRCVCVCVVYVWTNAFHKSTFNSY